jgi:hypothetical protein
MDGRGSVGRGCLFFFKGGGREWREFVGDKWSD